MQYHLDVLCNGNPKIMMKQLGPNTGFDSMGS